MQRLGTWFRNGPTSRPRIGKDPRADRFVPVPGAARRGATLWQTWQTRAAREQLLVQQGVLFATEFATYSQNRGKLAPLATSMRGLLRAP